MANNQIGTCSGCGSRDQKKHMIAMYAAPSSTPAKLICHMLEGCYADFLDKYEISEHKYVRIHTYHDGTERQ